MAAQTPVIAPPEPSMADRRKSAAKSGKQAAGKPASPRSKSPKVHKGGAKKQDSNGSQTDIEMEVRWSLFYAYI